MSLTVSWNTLSTFLKCPRMWKFQDDRVEYPKDSRNAILGIVVQKLFEIWYNEKHYFEKDSWLYENFDRVWQECQGEGKATGGWGAYCPWEDKQQELACMEETRDQIAHMFNMVVKHKLLAKVAKSEYRFKADIEHGHRISGSIDFLIEKPDEILLLDAKGTKYGTKYLDRRQLVYYKLGMVLEGGDKYRDARTGWLIYRTEKFEEIHVDDAELLSLKTLCVQVCDRITNGDFTAKPGDSCKFCNWKRKCPVINKKGRNDELF